MEEQRDASTFHHTLKVRFSEDMESEFQAISATFIITPLVSDLVCLLCHSKVVPTALCDIYLKRCCFCAFYV